MKIYLRDPKKSDASTILKWENDPENKATSGNEGNFSLEDIEVLIESFTSKSSLDQFRYVIVDEDSERLIGAVDVFEINQNKAKVGILIADKADRRKKLALQSLNLLENRVKIDFKIECLQANVELGNEASTRLFNSAGYQEKEIVDLDLFGNGQYIQTILFEKWLNE